ncbi:hypothetical protein [Mesorhizobium sp. M1378]|uniref:hypothetical protein n=1 Tax=unclassified Mesorhizobium TaxID=325217 RepID=UPI0033358F1D
MLRQLVDLHVPHPQRGADGIRQHQHRLAGVAVDAVGDACAIADGHEIQLIHGEYTFLFEALNVAKPSCGALLTILQR